MLQPLGGKSSGPDCALGNQEENALADILKWFVRIGAPKNAQDLRYLVKDYLDSEKLKSVFKDNLPSAGWVYSFLKRHPDLKTKSTEHHSPGRSAVTLETVKCWFRNCYLALKEENALDVLMTADRVWNCDESAFLLNLVFLEKSVTIILKF